MSTYTTIVKPVLEAHEKQRKTASPSYGHLPLIVLTQDYSQDRSPQGKQMAVVWDALQKDLASLSSNSQQSVAQHSGHYIQLDRPDLAITAILSVWQQARQSGTTNRRGEACDHIVFVEFGHALS